MISDFCYATANLVVTYGQAFIIIGGLTIGLLLAVRHRIKTKDRKYQIEN